MANIKSAIKRIKTNNLKYMQNRTKKSDLRTTIRKYNEAIEVDSPDCKEMLKLTIKKVDQAVSNNLLHKNAASRKKSQLQKAYNSLAAK